MSLDCSVVVVVVVFALRKVVVRLLGQGTVFEGVVAEVVSGQGVDLHFVELGLHEVREGAVLLARLAFIPIFDLGEAHASGEFFALDAVGHALVKSVAGVGVHAHGMHWFHH